jgi:heat-inducible transcriptional repressor
MNVSSATIRNEMAVLEQEGYLTQPHTSAGRIPTDKGYRFFVDQLTDQGVVDDAVSHRVGEFFDTAQGRLEELLQHTTTLLSQLTHHAAVVVGPRPETATVKSAHIVGLSSHHAMAVAVLSNGTVESQPIELPDDTSDVRLGAASAHLAATLVGAALDSASMLPSDDAQVSDVCRRAIAALRLGSADDHVFVGGASSMAASFDAVETVRSVLRTLEQQYVVVSLVRDVLDRGQSVAIGAEHGVEPLAACSVVVAPIVVSGQQLGTVGVLGPTRMNYPQALATVDVVSDRLGRRLEGDQ